MGGFFMDPASDWYPSVPVIINVIPYTIGPLYNGTRLQYNHTKNNALQNRVHVTLDIQYAACVLTFITKTQPLWPI